MDQARLIYPGAPIAPVFTQGPSFASNLLQQVPGIGPHIGGNIIDEILTNILRNVTGGGQVGGQTTTGPIPGPGQQNGGGVGSPRAIAPGGVACMGGYHPNKQGSWGPSGFTAKGTKLVKNRRMNPLNPRAAKRAIRRLSGLTAFARAMGFKGDVKIAAPRRRRY